MRSDAADGRAAASQRVAADLGLAARQVVYEQKQFWRNPPSAFFAFAFPLIFLVLFSSIDRGNRVDQLNGVSGDQYIVPAILAFGVLGATFTNLAMTLTIRRDSGVLKRLRALPLPPWAYIAGVVGSALITAFLLAALTSAVGIVFYGVTWEGRPLGLLVDVGVSAAALAALGIALSGLVPNGDAAPAVVNAVVIPLSFASGNFGYIDPGSVLGRIADLFPVRHMNRTVFAAFDPNATGWGVSGSDLLVVAAWGVAGVLLALRVFRWTPSTESRRGRRRGARRDRLRAERRSA